MVKKDKSEVKILTVDESHTGQRIDNYLFSRLKGLPKSRIYRAIRKGEIRVNSKRVKQDYKLSLQDAIRIPPLRVASPDKPAVFPSAKISSLIESNIIYEDSDLIILNKPAGIAVHGGSGISLGVIEILRQIRPKNKFLELIHRLDKETSGCLMIAKKSSILKEIHSLLVERKVSKSYLLLVSGGCHFKEKVVVAPLKKNILKSGERMVAVSEEGKPAKTIFRCLKQFENVSLVEAKPITGRTHQIRVHAAYLGYPIIGDEKYGDAEINKRMRKLGINQLCLHSAEISFHLESKKHWIGICAVLTSSWKEKITS